MEKARFGGPFRFDRAWRGSDHDDAPHPPGEATVAPVGEELRLGRAGARGPDLLFTEAALGDHEGIGGGEIEMPAAEALLGKAGVAEGGDQLFADLVVLAADTGADRGE